MISEELLSAGVGDIIRFGDFTWQILDIQAGKALLLSEKILELRQYNKKFIDVTWETGTLRQYLNDEFLDKFNEDEKKYITETKIHKNKNPWFNTKEGNATNDKVFLLSLGETVKYFGDSGWLSSRPSDARRIDDQFNSGRIAKDLDDTETWWWLRSPGFYGLNAAYVNIGGWIYVDGNNVNLYGGIRPAMWLNLQPEKENDSEPDKDNSKVTFHETGSDNFGNSFPNRRKTDEYMNLMFDAAPLCCSLWDENMNIIDCNKATITMFGLADKQEYINGFHDFSPPIQPCGISSVDLMRENHAKALKDGECRFEWMHRTRYGEPLPSEVTLIRVKSGNTNVVAGYVRDLREFNTTMAKMRETDELVQLMLDATPLCCNLWNDSYNIIECNQEAVKLFKLSAKQEYLEKYHDLSPPYQPCGRPSSETMLENIGKAFRDGYYRFGWMHQRSDNTPIPSDVILVRIKHKDSYIVAGYTRDLREHNKMINELETALKQATEASRAKSDFLSAMSHEMRTPMNVITGMTSIGKKAKHVDDKNHALNVISDTSAHLLGVINDVLDMAKIEADKLELTPVDFDFDEMLQKVMTVVTFRADEKKQKLIVNKDKHIPSYVIGDDQRLAQVITNLVDNAVKFSPENGCINLDISLIDERNDQIEIKIEVADNGIGMSPQQQNKIFKAFEQAESGMNREYGGTGLGLVISKNIIELMDGSIRVESDPGKGSKFIFTVKLLRCNKIRQVNAENKVKRDVKGEFAGKRMLLAEDVEINREILIALLEDTGLMFDCAVNGKEALDMIESTPERYDIIFMDLQMPQMDGYEATRRIRSVAGIDLPIVALSANVFTSDIEKCITAGMNDHLGKPLDMDKIIEVLRKYLT